MELTPRTGPEAGDGDVPGSGDGSVATASRKPKKAACRPSS